MLGHTVCLCGRAGGRGRLNTPLTCCDFNPRCQAWHIGQTWAGGHFCKAAGLLLKYLLCVHIVTTRIATVCISIGNVYILHALKYYNVVLALLHLYTMRGAVTPGGMCSGREELRDHVHSALRACKRRVRQKNLVSRESVDVSNNFIKSAACQ